MKKILTKIQSNYKIMTMGVFALIMTIAGPYIAFASDIVLDLPEPGGGVIAEIMNFIFGSLVVLGIALTGFAIIQIAIALNNKDADSKAGGLKLLLTGSIIIAAGTTFSVIF